jgi:pimeloyl-ACP methyl ester carboxylesterase
LFTVRRDDASTLDAAALAADYVEDLVVGTVREVHGAVAGRVHGINDRLNGGGPTIGHRLHDGIAKAVYGSIRVGFRAGSTSLRAASRAGLGTDIEATSRGRFVRAAVNGLIGDRLREEGSNFHFDMGVRVGGRDVPLDREGLAAAYPRASERLVVFVHGLSENEAYWNRAARPRTEARRERPEKVSYGERLAAEGWTPVYLRVNTGLPIAENGVALASLLDRLVAQWPGGVRRIALVGHSMGGLVMRAACAVVTDGATRWNTLVTDVVTLGTPHLGAPLERGVALGAKALGRLPE